MQLTRQKLWKWEGGNMTETHFNKIKVQQKDSAYI